MEGCLVMSTEEAAWVARAKAGDQAAFNELFSRYERRIYSYIYHLMGNAEDAHDLAQDTFLKAYRALEKTDEELNVSAWLHRIASNTCMDVLRQRRRFRWLQWESAKHERPSVRREDNPEDHLLGSEMQRGVRQALARMSPRARQALILREYEGLSVDDIAEVMNLSRGAVKSVLFRGREEFRSVYEAVEGQAK